MRKETGKSVYKGIALGTIHVLKKNDYSVRRESVEDTDAEIQRVKAATQKAGEELQALYEKALKEVGESNAAIFQVHQMMLEDEDYLDSIENIICTQKVNAEYATTVTGENFAEMFASMDDEYMQARSADIKDITERIVKCLCGGSNDGSNFDKPVIIVADDLAPSETVSLATILSYIIFFLNSNN